MTCPICFEKFDGPDDLRAFRRSCGHREHWDCTLSHLPTYCPVCRAPFNSDDRQVVAAYTLLHGDAAPDEENMEWLDLWAQESRQPEPIVPMDFVPLCCKHVGPPPEFDTMDLASMRWMPEGNIDKWMCYTCNREVYRTEQIQEMTREAPFCELHGPSAICIKYTHGTSQLTHYYSCVARADATYCEEIHSCQRWYVVPRTRAILVDVAASESVAGTEVDMEDLEDVVKAIVEEHRHDAATAEINMEIDILMDIVNSH